MCRKVYIGRCYTWVSGCQLFSWSLLTGHFATAVRAELRELGIKRLGMEMPDEVGRALAAGEMPAAIVLEATSPLALDPAVQAISRTAFQPC